jgi:uncharacterized membrane protein
MSQLIVAAAVFLIAHYIASTPLRTAIVGAVGQKGYLGLFSLLAFATIVWMIRAYLHAPSVVLWQSSWLRYLPLLVMPFALIYVAAALMSKNPTLVGMEGALKSAEPAQGIVRVTRHPLMWGIVLWAVAHILARGDAASLIFFGALAVLALSGTMLIDKRKAETLGEDWQRFAAVTSNVPFAAILGGRNQFRLDEIGWSRIGVGLALYVLILFVHPYLFGVPAY